MVVKSPARSYDRAEQVLLTSRVEVISLASHMTVTLTDEQYQVLAAEAARRGEPPEKYALSGRELAEQLYREGKLACLATRRPLTSEERRSANDSASGSMGQRSLANDH